MLRKTLDTNWKYTWPRLLTNQIPILDNQQYITMNAVFGCLFFYLNLAEVWLCKFAWLQFMIAWFAIHHIKCIKYAYQYKSDECSSLGYTMVSVLFKWICETEIIVPMFIISPGHTTRIIHCVVPFWFVVKCYITKMFLFIFAVLFYLINLKNSFVSRVLGNVIK